eukprot:m.121401 g.121401  ORF g.121401 m.121401 type:complete len:352 (-) comp19622_c1_seq2:265-1320(-)
MHWELAWCMVGVVLQLAGNALATAADSESGGIGLDSEGRLVLADTHNSTTLGDVLGRLSTLEQLENTVKELQRRLDLEHAGPVRTSCRDFISRRMENGVVPSASGYEIWCNMELDGGGWTLVAVSSDDGRDSWGWGHRFYWTNDTTTFGSLQALTFDFKSLALHDLLFRDLLFVHSSGVWASYHNVSTGTLSLGAFIGSIPLSCAPAPFTMTNGNLTEAMAQAQLAQPPPPYQLCTTNLYFNAMDRDGTSISNSTLDICSPTQQSGFGPVWSAHHSVCTGDSSLDDPGSSTSLGTCFQTNLECNDPTASNTGEHCHTCRSVDPAAVGFGLALGLNTAPAGSGGNYMRVFVR